ncbi:MAG: hypothetical protein IPM54_17340 [Polyangiaceae bacterium]|nr:hypothetical protein [Polyangiaceae bacterium]
MPWDHLTEADIARIQQLCDAATPGPWKAYVEDRDHESGSSFIQTGGADIELSGASIADYDFIANARQDVPRLVREVRYLRDALAKAMGQ